jgi:uncharacterized repeat protein (TIGR02543 family)
MNNVTFRSQLVKVRQIFTILVFLTALLGFNTAAVQAADAVQDLPILGGATWRYFKGTTEPPATWKDITFNDASWLSGPSGFGYGDNDDGTVLNDMTWGYSSVYIRKTFNVTDPSSVAGLRLSMDFDDGFVAYLNGTEIARENMAGTPPLHDAIATMTHEASHGDATPQPVVYYNLDPALLQAGTNVLAVQGHNQHISDVDFSLIPTLVVTNPSQQYTLTITNNVRGNVTLNPEPILGKYDGGTVVTLTPVPGTGYGFGGWTGPNAGDLVNNGNGTWSITMTGNKAITANYPIGCYALTLSHAGQGSDPTATPPKSSSCATNGQYVLGQEIALSGAVPSTGWQISSWTGTTTDSSTAATNSLIMPANAHTVSVNYTQIGYTLAVTSAHGTVAKNPNKATYTYDEIVQLTAAPATGWLFANWTGDATGTNNPVSVTMNNNKTITANYSPIEYTLAVTSAHGTVTKNPKGTYHYGDVVELTVVPAAGWHFVNWTGDATGASNPVSVTINGNKAVTANYAQTGYTLTVTSAHGTVTTSPEQAIYYYGDVVQLTAQPALGWFFASWSGDATGATNPLSVTMDADKSITANFIRSGADTVGVFRPSDGLLYLKNKNETGFADIALNYGVGGDYPVVGDWDGNGTVTIGIYRNGYFYLRNSNTIGFAEVVFPFGKPGDQPIAGDWNGDGVDTIGVFRPYTGQFLLRNSNTEGAAEMSFYLGNVGDVGIAGDWDGDGIDTTGVFRPINGLLYLKNKNETGFADAALNYGIPGDKPVTGDWDNDGIDTIGIYRNNSFYLRNSNTNGFAEIVFDLGNPGDMPIAGNWDGLP